MRSNRRAASLALIIGLLASSLSPASIAGQSKKSFLVWEPPPKRITRKNKPNRATSGRTGRKELATLLTLQWRLLRRGDHNIHEDANPETIFRTGEQVKLGITTNQSGYLYVINQPEGKPGVLIFPDERIDYGGNKLTKDKEYLNPDQCQGVEGLKDPDDCWWEFKPPAGEETLLLVFSRDAITSLPTRAGSPIDPNVIAELKRSSDQRLAEMTGEMKAPDGRNLKYATRVQNTNQKDNEELITTIRLRHVD